LSQIIDFFLPFRYNKIRLPPDFDAGNEICYHSGENNMKVKDIVGILKAEVLFEGNMEEEVVTACGSDMMSDVLAFVKDQSVLLTGLMNPQVIRTAEMMDMHCVIFVRGKQSDDTVISLAKEKNITILATPYRMFTACGLLYDAGLRGGCDID